MTAQGVLILEKSFSASGVERLCDRVVIQVKIAFLTEVCYAAVESSREILRVINKATSHLLLPATSTHNTLYDQYGTARVFSCNYRYGFGRWRAVQTHIKFLD